MSSLRRWWNVEGRKRACHVPRAVSSRSLFGATFIAARANFFTRYHDGRDVKIIRRRGEKKVDGARRQARAALHRSPFARLFPSPLWPLLGSYGDFDDNRVDPAAASRPVTDP